MPGLNDREHDDVLDVFGVNEPDGMGELDKEPDAVGVSETLGGIDRVELRLADSEFVKGGDIDSDGVG